MIPSLNNSLNIDKKVTAKNLQEDIKFNDKIKKNNKKLGKEYEKYKNDKVKITELKITQLIN